MISLLAIWAVRLASWSRIPGGQESGPLQPVRAFPASAEGRLEAAEGGRARLVLAVGFLGEIADSVARPAFRVTFRCV